LEKAGGEGVLLKGAALDRYLYPREDFRLGVDVDLLFRADDFERAEDILHGIAQPYDQFPGRRALSAVAGQKSFVMQSPATADVDVHCEFAQEGIFAVDYTALFARAVAHPAHPMQLRVLAPEDNLLHFALHAFKEKCLFTKHTVDAWLLLRAEPIDWPSAIARARAWGILLPLKYLLEGVRRVFGYELPESVNSYLRLDGMRRALAYRLMGTKPPADVRTGFAYRARQLGITWGLSGNVRRYLRYQGAYLVNRVRDGVGGKA
jgi:hypothetical protein